MFGIFNIPSELVLGLMLTLAASMPFANAQPPGFTVLYSFVGYGKGDGTEPHAGLIMDSSGTIYGTTIWGGKNNDGVVFKLAPDGTETVLHSFDNDSDGADPREDLLEDKQGDLYSMTVAGGSGGGGVVFELAPDGTETVLHSFCSGTVCKDGWLPQAGLMIDKAVNKHEFYGTTYVGGKYANGVVYKLALDGTYAVVHSFGKGSDGANPTDGLIADASGNLYGTTYAGGRHRVGTVFKLTPDGTESVLYSFTGRVHGEYPEAGLIMDAAGNFYGTTFSGGNPGCSQDMGCGTVFKLSSDGTETVLYSFTGGNDGANPYAGLVVDKLGNLYGTTLYGGNASCKNGARLGCGVVFKLASDGSETVLHTFTGKSDGSQPFDGLLLRGGYLYGTAEDGGIYGHHCLNGCGTIFRVKA